MPAPRGARPGAQPPAPPTILAVAPRRFVGRASSLPHPLRRRARTILTPSPDHTWVFLLDPAITKTQRLLDLICYLVGRRYPLEGRGRRVDGAAAGLCRLQPESARRTIECWRQSYSEARPHGGLGDVPRRVRSLLLPSRGARSTLMINTGTELSRSIGAGHPFRLWCEARPRRYSAASGTAPLAPEHWECRADGPMFR